MQNYILPEAKILKILLLYIPKKNYKLLNKKYLTMYQPSPFLCPDLIKN